MYKEIEINNFRGIKNLKTGNLSNFNLLVGKNNSGKTTVLEALFLLTGPTNPLLPHNINIFRGFNIFPDMKWEIFFNNLDTKKDIIITGSLKAPKENRELIIKPRYDEAIKINENEINEKGYITTANGKKNITGLDLEYIFKGWKDNIPNKHCSKIFKDVDGRIKLEEAKNYKSSINGIFIPARQIIIEVYTFLNDIIARKQEKPIIEILNQIEPRLQGLSIGADNIILCDIGLERLMPINILGDGMLRVLSIMLAIEIHKNGVIFIDEIENGLYYTTQKILWQAIFKTAKKYDVQVFATTHSTECIKAYVDSYKESYIGNDLFEQEEDDIRLFRIECNKDEHTATKFSFKEMYEALESGWEVR